MPKYNVLYQKQEASINNLLGNVDLAENTSRTNSNSISTNSASISNNKNLFQDTPQGQLDFTDLENQTWATNYTMNNSGINDTSSSSGSASETFGRTITGNNGNKYTIDVLDDIKNKFMNIDLLIINELSDLFMGIF